MFEKIRPLHDRVLVKRVEQEEKTAGGIILPKSAQEKAQIGEIVAVGAGRVSQDGTVTPLAVKAGERIFFGKYSGTEAGKEYIILREDEILGVVEE